MTDLRTYIAALSDRDAVKVVVFVTQSMQTELRQRQELWAELRGTILTDDEAANLLDDAFPELSKAFEQVRLTAGIGERGKIARNLLLVLSEETQYAMSIEKGIKNLSVEMLITVMNLTTTSCESYKRTIYVAA